MTDLHRHLGISFQAAERMGRKLMRAMMEGDAVVFLPSPVESSAMMSAEVAGKGGQSR